MAKEKSELGIKNSQKNKSESFVFLGTISRCPLYLFCHCERREVFLIHDSTAMPKKDAVPIGARDFNLFSTFVKLHYF